MDQTLRLTNRQLLYRALFPLAVIVSILWGSGGTSPSVPGALTFPHFDKVVHFFVFGLIATLIYRALPHWVSRRKAALLAIGLTSFFGFADEFRQSFNAERYASFFDWAADTAGAIVAVTAYRFWPFYRELLERTLTVFGRKHHGGRSRSQTY